MKKVSLIASLASGTRAIGDKNQLLFPIKEDLKRFKRLTTGHPVVMGRKTWESIGRALPNRTNIVISRDSSYQAPGATVVTSLEEALKVASGDTIPGNEEIFILGGGQIYAQALPLADFLYLTIVESDKDGDAHFPAYEHLAQVVSEQAHTDPDSGLKYQFVDLSIKRI